MSNQEQQNIPYTKPSLALGQRWVNRAGKVVSISHFVIGTRQYRWFDYDGVSYSNEGMHSIDPYDPNNLVEVIHVQKK